MLRPAGSLSPWRLLRSAQRPRLRWPTAAAAPSLERGSHGAASANEPPSAAPTDSLATETTGGHGGGGGGSGASLDGAEVAPPGGPGRAPARGPSSIDPQEVAKFARLADSWWDPRGPYGGLHAMGPTRVSFIRAAVCRQFGRNLNQPRPLEGLRILDVGSGGGLLCEPLARMGAEVTGVDAGEANVKVAALHAARDPATAGIEFVCATAEQLAEEGRQFDVVTALEVIEHVAEPLGFCRSLGALCAPGGGAVVSTLSRTLRSYALAIVAGERLLGWVEPGTHEWSKFVTPQELAMLFRRSGLQMEELAGMVYDPLRRKWQLGTDSSVNYIAFAGKTP